MDEVAIPFLVYTYIHISLYICRMELAHTTRFAHVCTVRRANTRLIYTYVHRRRSSESFATHIILYICVCRVHVPIWKGSPSQSFVTHICRVYWGANSIPYRYTYGMAIPSLKCICVYIRLVDRIHVYKPDGEGAHPISCIYMYMKWMSPFRSVYTYM